MKHRNTLNRQSYANRKTQLNIESKKNYTYKPRKEKINEEIIKKTKKTKKIKNVKVSNTTDGSSMS